MPLLGDAVTFTFYKVNWREIIGAIAVVVIVLLVWVIRAKGRD